jgi:hypothetical protein
MEHAMSGMPLKYMGFYRPLQFTGCSGQGQKYARINKYISGDGMSSNAFRKKAYLDFKQFVEGKERYADGANGAAGHRYFADTGYLVAVDLRPVPFHYCPWADVRQGFQGKNTPARMNRVVKMLDYYLLHAEIDPAVLGWGKVVTDLQEYVDYYIGMDCNGFVGAWLEENRPASGIVHNIDIDSYGYFYGKLDNEKGSGFTRIDDPTAIRAGDVLIRRRIDGSTRHIALVEQVTGSSSKQAQLLLAESTGGSGLGSNSVVFKKLAKADADGRRWKRGEKLYDAVLRSI